tara:strand:+ start:3730 stop:4587 length:858 start_codon:yes stop_codon:yes gene_type:complete
MKIGLGSVQWGVDYGIANETGIPSDKELVKIVQLAKSNNINLIDTAISYGKSQIQIGKFCDLNFKIVSKLLCKSDDNVKEQIDRSLNELNRKKIYSCLFHDPLELLKNPDMWKDLENQKQIGKIKKIGFSLYRLDDLESLLENNLIPDIVQIPYNCLNTEFNTVFKYLKNINIEIHARSIFFQGLLFCNPNKLPKYLSVYKPIINKLKKIADNNNLKIYEMALLFAFQNEYIDNFIIGIETKKQLAECIDIIKFKSINSESIEKILFLDELDEKLLNPSNWKREL